MTSLDKYATWSEKDVAEQIERTKTETEEGDFLVIKPDTEVVIRVVPPKGGGDPHTKFAKHFYKDPRTGKMISFACPQKSRLAGFDNYDCPVCAMAQNMIRRRSKAERDLGFQMRAKWKILTNVLLRPADSVVQRALDAGKAPPQGRVKLWETSSWAGEKNGKNMHEKLLAIRANSRIGGNYADPTANGFDILLERQGEKMNTVYTPHALTAERKPLLPDLEKAVELIENGQIDVEWYILPPTPEDLQQILQGERPNRDSSSQDSFGSVPTAGELVAATDFSRGGDTGAGF